MKLLLIVLGGILVALFLASTGVKTFSWQWWVACVSLNFTSVAMINLALN